MKRERRHAHVFLTYRTPLRKLFLELHSRRTLTVALYRAELQAHRLVAHHGSLHPALAWLALLLVESEHV